MSSKIDINTTDILTDINDTAKIQEKPKRIKFPLKPVTMNPKNHIAPGILNDHPSLSKESSFSTSKFRS